MKLLKKIVAFTLALTMIASFASCSKKANEDSSESSESSSSSSETSANDSSSAAVSGDETAAVTEAPPAPLVYKDLKGDHFAEASGHKISEDEYKYYFSYAKSSMDGGDAAFWTEDHENKLAQLKSTVNSYIEQDFTVVVASENNGVKLSDVTKSEKEDKLADFKKQYTGSYEDFLTENKMTEELLLGFLGRQILEEKLVAKLYLDKFMENEFKDYIRATHILFPITATKKVDENNQPTEEVEDMYKLIDGLTYTDEEKAAIDKLNAVVKANDTEAIKAEVKVFAEFVLKLINDGGDFETYMTKYNTDPGETLNEDKKYTGYYFTKGAMVPAFEEAAYGLKEDAVSGVVKSDYGFHIIKRLPMEKEYIDDNNNMLTLMFQNTAADYMTQYQDLLTKEKSSLEIVYNSKYEDMDETFFD